MKFIYCCVLFATLALPSYAQRPGSGLVITRLEDFIEITKHVAENSASAKSHVEARPAINRLLVIAAFDFVQITRNAPSREAYLESMDQHLAQLEPLMALTEDRVQVAEFYDELLEMVGVASTDGRLDEFARRVPNQGGAPPAMVASGPPPSTSAAGPEPLPPSSPPAPPRTASSRRRKPPKTTVPPTTFQP